jgi:hypothetical protein
LSFSLPVSPDQAVSIIACAGRIVHSPILSPALRNITLGIYLLVPNFSCFPHSSRKIQKLSTFDRYKFPIVIKNVHNFISIPE